MNDKPEYWIEKLGMKAHPEGGYFSEIYRSKDLITGLPARFQGTRCCSTSIYFLLKNDQFSAFHRIKSDEIWHYYTGTSSIELFVFNNLGNLEIHKLGQDIAAGEVFQFVIPAGYWFAAKLIHPRTFALIGCTVSPGFEFEDFELAKRRELTMTFPQHKKLIEMLSYS